MLIDTTESGNNYFQTNELVSLNTDGEDFSFNIPLNSDTINENIVFQQLPNPDLLDNTNKINEFFNYLEDKNTIYDRPPSIIATYFIVSTLYSIDPILLLSKADKILEYLLGQYNTDTEMFEDNINYSFYNEHFESGKQLLLAPYTPEITHEMALVILKKCDKLSFFSGTQINKWITEIWGNQNIDGGFGTLYSPNSTLLETYYSVEGLLILNDYDISIFSSFQRNAIGNFINNRQRTSDWAPSGIGSFGEYSRDIFLGWEFFYASWLALNTIEMIGGDFSNVKEGFIDFIIDNNLNNPITHCFHAQWNDWASPHIVTYYGTAILGDCIRLLNAEAQFPDLSDSQSTLISANIIEKTGSDLNYNFFYKTSDVRGDDLFSQYLIVNYLSKVDLWNIVDEQEFIEYYFSFITENGGGTYISNIWDSAKGDFLKYNSLKYSGINVSEIYDIIMSRLFVAYFSDLRNISTNPQDQSFKILQHWNEWIYYPIATNYFSIKLLDEYDLLDEFYAEVGTEYNGFIDWIHGRLSLEGYFHNSIETVDSGNLESTYYALESQRILLDFDEFQDIDDYYTIQEINSILSYCEQFIIEDDNYWYVNCSSSLENKELGKFQALKYILSIEENLGGNAINSEKLKNFLLFTFENEWDMYSIQEKTDLLSLMVKMDCSYVDLISETSHLQIRDQIQYIITQDHYPEEEVNFISQLLKDSNIRVYMDIPSNQILGERYTYLAQFSSISSVISVENLSIEGFDINFNDWYSLGSMVACEVMPQFDEFNPYLWDISLDFKYRDNLYSYPFSMEISVPILTNAEIDFNSNSIVATLSMECADSLVSRLEPNLYLYNFEDQLIGRYQIEDMNINQDNNIKIFECGFSETLQDYQNYTLVWQFNFDFIENISVNFQFIAQEIIKNIPPDLLNETTINIENSSTLVSFLIRYSDPEGMCPDFVKIIIDGGEYDMNFINGDFQTGAFYGIDLNMAIGQHEYYFMAGDLENIIRFPTDHDLEIIIEEFPNEDLQNDTGISDSSNDTINISPKLSDVQVSQKTKYHYEFSIIYSDEENDSSEFVRLFVNETPYLMNFQYMDHQSNLVFQYDLWLEAGNYTYYFTTNDGKNSTRYPEIGFLNLYVDGSSGDLKEKPINYIIEALISFGSVGSGISGFVFKNKEKIYSALLARNR